MVGALELSLELKQQTITQERSRLFNFIKGRVSNTEDAEDILQEVLYAFFDKYTIGTTEKAVAWLFSVARNKIIDKYRKKKLVSASLDESASFSMGEENLRLKDIIPDLGNTPEDVYLRNVIWEKIWEALNELPKKQRFVFIQNELEGISFRELAEESGESINTLLSRKRYAITALRDKLEELYREL